MDNDRLVKARIDELIKILNEANYDYYILDNPKITDQEFDKYLRELEEIELEYPYLKREDSPTNRVGGGVSEGFSKVTHTIPMLSIGDVFNEEEIINFDQNIANEGYHPEYVCELKIDGLSVSLHYEKGILTRAATRGTGAIGDDITTNVKTIRTVPLKLKEPVSIEVRGEIYMEKRVLQELNREREAKNLPLLQNCRNAASGSIKLLDSREVAKRHLSCFIYHLPNPLDYGLTTHEEALNYMKKLGFRVNNNNKKVKNIGEILDYINKKTAIRDSLEYDIDGVVIKVNDIMVQQKLGYTNKYPKWCIAYKFPATICYTKLIDIIFTVGRTGQITPNAVLEPVTIQGSTIRRATLHNEDNVVAHDIRIGDIVEIYKAGDVIPAVGLPLVERRNGSEKVFQMIDKCPICGTKIIRKESEADYFCPNLACPARNVEGIIHFASKNAMNIDGLGDSIIEDLYNYGYLKDISDIYGLKQYKKELEQLEGYGEKSVTKLFESIEKSKSNSLEKLIFGLGIKQVGEKTASILASHYKNLDALMLADNTDLTSLKDIGPIIADSVVSYFKDSSNKDLIMKLKSYNLNTEFISTRGEDNANFKDLTFVLTGTLNKITRDEASKLIKNVGGKTTSSVTKKTSVVIVGDNPGSKYTKALDLGIEVWDEDKFLELINYNTK